MAHSITVRLNKPAREFQAGGNIGFNIRTGVQYYDRQTKKKEWTNYSAVVFAKPGAQADSLVDLKFIMADTGFGKTFIYDRIKSGDLPKAKVIHGRARWLYRDHCEFKNKLLSRANG